MIDKTPWEQRPEQRGHPERVEQFKKAYLEPSLSLELIGETFGLGGSTCHSVARRLGLTLRVKREPPKPAEVLSLGGIEAEMQRLKQEMRDLEDKRSKLLVRAEVSADGREVAIYGLTPEPFTTTTAMAREWLKLGPSNLRDKLGHKEDK